MKFIIVICCWNSNSFRWQSILTVKRDVPHVPTNETGNSIEASMISFIALSLRWRSDLEPLLERLFHKFSRLAQTENENRQHRLGNFIRWKLCKRFRFNHQKKRATQKYAVWSKKKMIYSTKFHFKPKTLFKKKTTSNLIHYVIHYLRLIKHLQVI